MLHHVRPCFTKLPHVTPCCKLDERCERVDCGRLAARGSTLGSTTKGALCSLHTQEDRVDLEGLAFVLLALAETRQRGVRRVWCLTNRMVVSWDWPVSFRLPFGFICRKTPRFDVLTVRTQTWCNGDGPEQQVCNVAYFEHPHIVFFPNFNYVVPSGDWQH